MAVIARHHAEWLSLVEISGPFLSMRVLMRAFPQGLDAHDPEVFRSLRLAYEEWQEDVNSKQPDPALHGAWIEFVLRTVLGWDDQALKRGQEVPQTLEVRIKEHGVTLRAGLAVVAPSDFEEHGSPRMLVQVYPPGVGLERALRTPESAWCATPATRMMELLHGTGVRLGLVTNGEHWMLVDAPRGQTTGFVSWYAQYWLEEKVTLQAFRSLLSVQRFFGVDPKDRLDALLAESASDQFEVTDQLGYQVRRAVEVLIQAIDRVDRERRGALLQGVTERELYGAALTVMMRLVFLLSAEEQGRLFASSTTWKEHYGAATLRDQLREVADRHGEEVLERRHDAWARLLAAFRAVHGGMTHEAMRSPAYGGGLFDPDRYPFLEGRGEKSAWRTVPADPLPIHNRTVLHLLDALQVLQVKVPGGGPAEARRLSFRALGVEQIGHVYEGLLDHTAVRAKEPVLGLKGPKDREEEVPLSQLEAQRAKGPEAFVAWLADATNRSSKALQKEVAYGIPDTDKRWAVVRERNDALYQRVAPFAGLVRDDTVGQPILIHEGSVYVTQGDERRSTGTHYTPPSLTEPIVRHTLEPLVYRGPAEGTPQEQWELRSAEEILALRVCDMAMGSGAFLVQACRYLAERVVEAWGKNPERGVRTLPGAEASRGVPSERLLPNGVDERLALARRLVADRCLYGVDKNPMAVEMAKLSLWLVTFERERPFTFVDHALRCGDSLLGLTDPEQVKWFHLDPARGRMVHQPDDVVGTRGLFNFVEQLGPAFEKAAVLRRRLEALPDDDIRDSEAKARLLHEAEQSMALVRVVADLVIASALEAAGKGQRKLDERLVLLEMPIAAALDLRVPWSQREKLAIELTTQASRILNSGKPKGSDDRRPFHWALEFPEVFAEAERRGFDAIVGNPPFMGGLKLQTAFGSDWRAYLVEQLAHGVTGVRGTGDLCAYFFLRSARLLSLAGTAGILATKTIAQGDSRLVGLDQMLDAGTKVYRAIPQTPWPGSAALDVAVVWFSMFRWRGHVWLDTKRVSAINAALDEADDSVVAKGLAANDNRAFVGSFVLNVGGFSMSESDAHALIDKSSRNAEVLFPFYGGDDIVNHPNVQPSRWVIHFRDWPLDRVTAPVGYQGTVAADYPECLNVLRTRVLPERKKLQGSGSMANRRAERWWLFSNDARFLYRATAPLRRALGTSGVSKYLAVAWVPATNVVYAHTSVVFADDSDGFFAVMQSSHHDLWCRSMNSTLGVTLRYTPKKCFDTFPFPRSLSNLDSIGQSYDRHRRRIMIDRSEGLTKTYNRFHDPKQSDSDSVTHRTLRRAMDQAVAAAYGWTDLDLGHGFHATAQGVRYTMSESARRQVLARLLRLNHEHYAEEVAAGLHDKKKSRKSSPQPGPDKATRDDTTAERQGKLF